MLYVQLEVGWLDHEALIGVGLEGRGAHAVALVAAKRAEADGWFWPAVLRREGATDELIDRMVEVGLLECSDDGRIRPGGWLDRNPSQGAIDAIRASKQRGGAIGNHRRWRHPGGFDTCTRCHPDPEEPQVNRSTDPIPIATDRMASPETETETEREQQDSSKSQDNRDSTPPGPEPQALRHAAALVARTIADREATGSPAGLAAVVAERILLGPDPTDRDRITDALATGDAPEAIAAAWHQTTPPAAEPVADDRPRLTTVPPTPEPTAAVRQAGLALLRQTRALRGPLSASTTVPALAHQDTPPRPGNETPGTNPAPSAPSRAASHRVT